MVYRIGYGSPVYSIQTSAKPGLWATEVFELWLDGLKDRRTRARIQARVDRAEDCKPIGEGVSEMRIHHGPGCRVYFKHIGSEVVILLAGGDKSTQASDIRAALRLARRLEV